ncbi:MAG TPA: hypothetical protein VJ890_15400 [Vineibacter sp.]|nr:hypothetical protein [Vineibacter sp.]
MRDDMARVIVERPRRRIDSVRKGRERRLGELPHKQGLRRFNVERGGRTHLNENLAPLRRFLERQVGRPWSKVYSEICARLRVDSTVQQHVRDHLEDFVALAPRRGIHMRFSWHKRSEGLWDQPLYVDPRDGLLKRTDLLPEEKVRRRREAEARRKVPPVERVPLSAERELRCLDGIWYEIRLAPMPEATYREVFEPPQPQLDWPGRKDRQEGALVRVRRLISPPVRDFVTGKNVEVGPAVDRTSAWAAYRKRYPDRRYAAAKRQISTAELRRHGLSNRSAADP